MMTWMGADSFVTKKFSSRSMVVYGIDAQFAGGGLALLGLCGVIWLLLQRSREIKKATEAEAESAQNKSEHSGEKS